MRSQSRQSARLFSPLVRIGISPPPHRQASVSPPVWFGGRGDTRWGERGGSQFRRGDRHCGTLGIYVLCVGSGSRYCMHIAQIGYSLFNLFKDHVFPFHVGTQNGNIFDATVFANLMKLYDMKNNFSSLYHFCSM